MTEELTNKEFANKETIWDRNRGKIRSSKGGWLIGKGVINQGFEMMEDFVGKLSYMQVIIFNATGKMPTRALADWFDAIHICLSWPDPRIWCNHIGALGGTVRTSAVSATTMGILATDSRAYGIKPLEEGLKFIQHSMREFESGVGVEEIVHRECAKNAGKPYIMGYARPVAKGDERVDAMIGYAEELHFPVGKHLNLAFAIEKVLLAEFGESMNINGYMSAFLSDQDFSPLEVYRICSILVASGVTACYVDTRDKPADTFFPLQCGDINYSGVPPRKVPV